MKENLTRPAFLDGESTPIWIVITGKVRSGREFRETFRQALELRDSGFADGIVFSTWHEDLENSPGLQQALAAAGIRVVTSAPPPEAATIHPMFHGYRYFQRKSLQSGLNCVPQGAFVLKTRTDFAEERFDAMARTVFSKDCPGLPSQLKQPLLKTPLFTFDARPDYLFYWDDIVFCGNREDLLRLNNCDITPDVFFPEHSFSTECRFFSPLFLSEYPILRWFFENTNGRHFAAMLHKCVAEERALPELVHRILASYLHILSRYAILPKSSGSKENSSLSLKSLFTPDEALGIHSFPTPWPSHKFGNDTCIEILRKADPDSHEASLRPILEMIQVMDVHPSLRGEIPQHFEQLVDEFHQFDQAGQFTSYRPQSRVYKEKATGEPANISILDSVRLPEKRHLTWSEAKSLGFRRKASAFLLDKLL